MDAPRGPARPGLRFLLAHPAHFIALGFGAGLSPVAPGTVGTAWAWLSFLVFDPWLGELGWAWVMALGWPLGWWAATRSARALRLADPGAIVIDEILAFWLVLWLITPASLTAQALAFLAFRVLDTAKPGPVGWADAVFKRRGLGGGASPPAPGWAQGFGILLDDAVAAFCLLVAVALWRFGVALA